MIEQRAGPIRTAPPNDVARGPARASISAPEDDQGKAESGGDGRQARRMAERIGRVQDVRRARAKRAERAAAGEQIADEGLTVRDQLVGEDVPGASLESSIAQPGSHLRTALGTHREIILEHDRLAVEQKG